MLMTLWRMDKKFELNATVHYGGNPPALTSSSGPTSSLFNISSVWSSRTSKSEGSLWLWWWWWWCWWWWSRSRQAVRCAWYPFSSDERDNELSALPWDFPDLFDSSCLRKHSKLIKLLGAALAAMLCHVEPAITLIGKHLSKEKNKIKK